jgi:hypothetical protein
MFFEGRTNHNAARCARDAPGLATDDVLNMAEGCEVRKPNGWPTSGRR